MNKAIQFIKAIASNMSEVEKPLIDIRNVLEDGEALGYLGATDEDQEMIEDAHAMVSGWIDAGLTTLDQALKA